MAKSLVRGSGNVTLPVLRRWRAADARAVLKRLGSSGLTVPEFAAREGLDDQRLYRWRAQLRAESPAFVEMTPTVAARAVEVVLRSGHVLRVSDGFGEDALRRVVEILEDRGPRC